VHVGVGQLPAFRHYPVPRREHPRSNPQQPHTGRRLVETGAGFAGPEVLFQADVPGEKSPVLELSALRESDVAAAPEFFKAIGPAEVGAGPFLNLKRMAAQPAEFALDVLLEH